MSALCVCARVSWEKYVIVSWFALRKNGSPAGQRDSRALEVHQLVWTNLNILIIM